MWGVTWEPERNEERIIPSRGHAAESEHIIPKRLSIVSEALDSTISLQGKERKMYLATNALTKG